MTNSAADSPTLANASPPKSCLELLTILRRLEALVDARIRWHAGWPPSVDPNRGIRFPVVVYDGTTQTKEESLLAEHHARQEEFRKLEQTLPPLFTDLDLPVPQKSDFQISRTTLRKKRASNPVYGEVFQRAREFVRDFWGKLAAYVQAEVFKRKELSSAWTPEVINWPMPSEPPANRQVYPPVPIRSLIDMEKWLGLWIERCTLPECPATTFVGRVTDRNAVSVTIKVPSTRPPFRSPVEGVWRCQLDDLVRELRNCSRTCHEWGLLIDSDWEGAPPSFRAAEDRVMAVIKNLRKYRQAALEKLGAWHSGAEIGRMPVAVLLARLAEASTETPKRSSRGGDSPSKKATRKTGRPKGSIASNLKEDKRIYDLWKQGRFKTKAEFARNLPAALQHFGIKDVVAAIERQRKRLRTSGNN